jgi:hypothetical protein
MNHYQIIIALMLAAQLFTAFLIWEAVKRGDAWQAAWTREAAELLLWKRHAVLRDPKTGKYTKKDKQP